MIKKIIACADIHIRNYKRMDEYQIQLNKFIDYCKNYVNKYDKGEVCIVIAGDLVHSKTDLSPECYDLTSWFLNQLDNIAETIVIAGNHDFNASNSSRMDPISVIFSMNNFKQTRYLDKELNMKSGCIIDQNIVWCLYSAFDQFVKPNIDETKIKHPDETYVALYHGDILGSKTDVGFMSEIGVKPDYFSGVNFGIFGHIHRRQCIPVEGINLVYCGSLIQQDHGENISGHGFVIWDVEDESYETVNLENNDYGFYTFQINDPKDIDENKEVLINL